METIKEIERKERIEAIAKDLNRIHDEGLIMIENLIAIILKSGGEYKE